MERSGRISDLSAGDPLEHGNRRDSRRGMDGTLYFTVSCRGEWRIGRLARTVPVHAVCVTASFFGAYGLVNLYNLSKHSPANTLGEFLIPLLSDSYMVDILHLDLPMYPSAYMGVIVLFLIGTVMGISTWFYPKQKNEGQVQLLFS